MATARLLLVTDSHAEQTLVPTAAARADAAEQTATNESVDCMLHIGDAVSRTYWATDLASYIAALTTDYLAGGGKVVAVIGNHDVDPAHTAAQYLAYWGQTGLDFESGAADGSYGVFPIGTSNVYGVVLDINYDTAGNYRTSEAHNGSWCVSAQQKADIELWMDEIVEALAPVEPVFVVFAHQRYADMDGTTSYGKQFFASLALTYNVAAFISGHGHSGILSDPLGGTEVREQPAALNGAWVLGLVSANQAAGNAYSILEIDDASGSVKLIAFGQEMSMAAKYMVATGAFEADSAWALSAGGAAGGVSGCNCAPTRWDDVILDAATGSITAACNEKPIIGSLTGEGGAGATIDFDGYGVDVYGDIMLTGGYMANTGDVTQMADGDIRQSSMAWQWDKYILPAGVMATRQNYVYAAQWEIRGTLNAAASWHRLGCYRPSGTAAHWVVTGTVNTAGLKVIAGGGLSYNNTGEITCGEQVQFWQEWSGTTPQCVQSGRLVAGSVSIAGQHGSVDSTMDMKIECGALGDVTLGNTGAIKHGRLSLGAGYVAVDSLAHLDDADTGSSVDLASGVLETSGAIDFAGLSVTADADDVAHIVGVGAPQIGNFACNHLVHAHGCADGGTNTDIDFDAYAAPGSLALCGAGI